MIKSAKEINETKQNFLQSLSDAENLSKQLSEQSQKCTEIEETIKQIAESKINYKDDEEYLKLEKWKNDINAKMHDIKSLRAVNYRCRQKRIDAAKAAKLNVEGQRNNRSKYCLLIKLLKFFLLLPSFYLVYIIIRSFFHVFDLDDCIFAIVNAIVIIIMIIIYFIIYSLICGILDAVNERIMRKRKVKVTPEPIKISDIDTSEYDKRIDKFNLQIVALGEELKKCEKDKQSYFDEKEKDKNELLKKECEHLDKVKRELDRIKNELDKSILVSEHKKYKERLESEFLQKENVLYLNVSDNQEDEVKALGAKWNPELKKWYVPDDMNYFQFKKWFNNKDANIICKNLYLIETKSSCWKCGKQSKIVCLASDEFYTEFYGLPEECITRLILFQYLTYLPDYLERFLSSYNLNYKYSRRFFEFYKGLNNGFYLCNVCEFCGTVQGDFFLHHLDIDMRSRGFYQCIDGIDENLKIYKLNNLQGAVELRGFMHSRDSREHMITEEENLSSIDADEFILNQANLNQAKKYEEIDMTSYLEETQVKN